jgi:hypothetical protein
VDDASDAGALGSLDQYLRIGDCLRKAELRWLVEPNPIGVDQNLDAAKRLFELARLGEIIRKRLNCLAERIAAERRVRQCDHIVLEVKQALRNVLA